MDGGGRRHTLEWKDLKMAHLLEKLDNGSYSMAWTGETPWHGKGKKVADNLTPQEMLEAANLDWTVGLKPVYFHDPKTGKLTKSDSASVLVRSDGREMDIVTHKWQPLQNAKAFEFFDEFVSEGRMKMHTAGSILNGRKVWGLAKMERTFRVGKQEDVIEDYLLFTNPHEYGKSIDIRYTPVRVVCNNTLTMALGQTTSNRVFRQGHRAQFNAEAAKEVLGLVTSYSKQYEEKASFLASKRYTTQQLEEYIDRVFPVLRAVDAGEGKRKAKQRNLNASKALDIIDTQPGADLNPESWWNALNVVTFLANHEIGRTQDARLDSVWYGNTQQLQIRALDLAMEYAAA